MDNLLLVENGKPLERMQLLACSTQPLHHRISILVYTLSCFKYVRGLAKEANLFPTMEPEAF